MDSLVEAYQQTRNANYLATCGYTLAIADFIHTFSEEVRLMWPIPLSSVKVLFFVARYYTLLHLGLSAMYHLRSGLTPGECTRAFVQLFISSSMAVLSAEVILYMRVYALSGMNKRLMAYLAIQYLILHGFALRFTTKILVSVRFEPSPIPNLPCIPIYIDRSAAGIVFCLSLASTIAIMAIMVYISRRQYRDFESSLISLFFRDGVLYFICLSTLTCANIVSSNVAPPPYKFITLEPQVLSHSILATRMLMHLRGWAERDLTRGASHRSVWDIELSMMCRDPERTNPLSTHSEVPAGGRAEGTDHRLDNPGILEGRDDGGYGIEKSRDCERSE
ncbi:hypothetical protein DFP72DRAFT_880722 [Ephemerocybe angulata]|uniref:DUF6533 domain-containing protein n=1 Tax=Ephemerocybe angulata TaxID=980116 RepID=A0A8H6I9B9_9AGAR|nr:hypothetical protein DFP72DRAFT_880722 [Tulosesus angulatus]